MTKITNQLHGRQRYDDQSRAQRAPGRVTSELPNFKFLLFGILIGVFSTSLIVFIFSTTAITLKLPIGNSESSVKLVQDNISVVEPVQLEQAAVTPEPRFDFYTELTKNTIENNTSTLNINDPDLKSAPKPINGYIVQIGSFRKNTDADAIKAKLTLNGFNAKIEPIKLLDGEIRHRVILGPFKTEKHAQLMQQQLKALKIDSLCATI